MENSDDEQPRPRGRELLDKLIAWNERDPNGPIFLFFAVAVLLTVFVGIALAILAIYQRGDMQSLGQSADFFTGFLSPILSLLTFAGVLYTVLLQGRENRSQAEFLERQSFEATFFKMLDFHDSIVNAIDLVSPDLKITKGRDCFKRFAHRLRGNYLHAKGEMGTAREVAVIGEAYKDFWQNDRQNLGHYMRFLYNVLRYVDTFQLGSDESLEGEKRRYVRILRAQLSDFELVVLFYNCVSPYGLRFQRYAHKYKLFDNLAPDLLFDLSHIDEFPELGPVSSASLDREDIGE